MAIRLYNTRTRSLEDFVPLDGRNVKMYVCGVTVYDDCHLGHGRAYVVFDCIRRFLEYGGYNVFYVQNFTDIDDKIIKRANESGLPAKELAEKYIGEYFSDIDALNVKRASVYVKATDMIPDMIAMIEALIQKGFAYESGGDVFFSVTSFGGYGKLSGKKTDDLLAGARINVNEKKNNPLDFALWKKAKEGEPSWDSPWGPGRPGWHIECSVMSMKYLGETMDIHGGGSDLIFPHHENETAQSESFSGKDFVKYWVHNGFVTLNDEKMSKSLGNFFRLKDIYGHFSPELVRYFLLTAHYRKPLDFSDRALLDAKGGYGRINDFLLRKNTAGPYLGKVDAGFAAMLREKKSAFLEAMENDFNTPQALGVIFELISETMRREAGPDFPALYYTSRNLIREFTGVLGLDFSDDKKAPAEGPEPYIDLLLEVRMQLRAKKDFESADVIREKLLSMGVVLEDGKEKSAWKRAL